MAIETRQVDTELSHIKRRVDPRWYDLIARLRNRIGLLEAAIQDLVIDAQSGNPATAPVTPTTARTFGLVVDGGGSVPGTGYKGVLVVPWNCTIQAWTMLAANDDSAGSAQITIYKGSYSSYPSGLASIVGSNPPAIGSALKAQATSLSGWLTQLAAGEILVFLLDSISVFTRLTLIMEVEQN